MGVISDAAVSSGDLMRRVAELERQVAALTTARRLEAAAVGRGGLRVHSGGGITLEDGGDLHVADGGEILATGTETERVRISDGIVRLTSEGASEGSLRAAAPATDRVALFINPPALTGSIDDNGITLEGASTLNAGNMFFTSVGTVIVDSRVGSVFAHPKGAYPEGFLAFGGQVVLLAIDGNGDPITNPDLGAFSGTESGTYTSYVTTSNAPNCHVFTSSGRIAVSTSSARHKTDIEDLVVDPAAVLALRPRTWRDRGEVRADPETDRWHVGLVAEEVVDAGLEEFVEFDADGQPRYIAYDRLAVALLEVVKQQQRRLNDLDGAGEPSPLRQGRARKPPRRATEPRLRLPPSEGRRTRGGSARRSGTR